MNGAKAVERNSRTLNAMSIIDEVAAKVDFILAVGGGSVIDSCKVVSAQAMLDEDIWNMEYGKGKMEKLPVIPPGKVESGAEILANTSGTVTLEPDASVIEARS